MADDYRPEPLQRDTVEERCLRDDFAFRNRELLYSTDETDAEELARLYQREVRPYLKR